jgi:hypothetical protein
MNKFVYVFKVLGLVVSLHLLLALVLEGSNTLRLILHFIWCELGVPYFSPVGYESNMSFGISSGNIKDINDGHKFVKRVNE